MVELPTLAHFPNIIRRFNSKIGRIDVTFISNGPLYWKSHPSQAEALLREFERIQDSVWQKSHPTLENSFNVGSLLYLSVDQKPIGFLSAKYVSTAGDTETIFFSDAMILRRFQGNGLCSLAFKTLQDLLFKNPYNNNAKKFCVFLSSHIATFAHFSRCPRYKRILYGKLDRVVQNELYRLAVSCGGTNHGIIDEEGIVSGVFKPQSLEDYEAWPKDLADHFNLPSGLSYKKGDGLLGIFQVVEPPELQMSDVTKMALTR